MKKCSSIFSITVGVIYPFIIFFGIYIIINGHLSPGGGFQGGAILASAFIIQYLASDTKEIDLTILNKIEKVLYLALLVFSVLFVQYINPSAAIFSKGFYLITMNILI